MQALIQAQISVKLTGLLNKPLMQTLFVYNEHKSTKQQIALEPKDCQKYLSDWDHLFLKDNILDRKHSVHGTEFSELVCHDIALASLHDESGHQHIIGEISVLLAWHGWRCEKEMH